jgi:hypothetical protein
MQRAGILNSKSGTWLERLATQSFPGTSLMSKIAYEKHEKELKSVGLIDEHNQPTFLGDDGKPDLLKLTRIAGEHLAAMPDIDRLATEKAIWGQQGGRAAAFFSDPTNQKILAQSAAGEKDFKSGAEAWQAAQANSPIVQMRTAFADFNSALMNIGATTLPLATTGIRALDGIVRGISDWSKDGPNKDLIDHYNAVTDSHIHTGRDPRSPQTGTLAYFPALDASHSPSGPHGVVGPAGPNVARAISAPPVTVNAQITAPLNGEIHATFGSITANFPGIGSLVGQIASAVAGKLSGQLRTGIAAPSSSGFNSAAHPASPDMGAYGPSY